MKQALSFFLVFVIFFAVKDASAEEKSIPIWPGLAPAETSAATGTVQAYRPGENPPVTRVTNIRKPSLDLFLAEKPNGTAILILPGGGFAKVVADKEGSEAAAWLNQLGISAFVLRYRTKEETPKSEPLYLRPLQDAQRALRLIRANAEDWKINPQKIGVLGFSAGGQVASILHTKEEATYKALDQLDHQSCKPNFSLLVYPWRIWNSDTQKLIEPIKITKTSPTAFIVHTHDDGATSVGAAMYYVELKKLNIPAELHIYENGGHGYGMRKIAGSNIGTWPDRATDWLRLQQYANPIQTMN